MKTLSGTAAQIAKQARSRLEQGVPIPTPGKVLWPEPYNQDTPEALYRFVTECCWTYNESDRKIDLIPAKDYVRIVVEEWHEARKTGRTLIIEKSRRMVLSWVVRACELWSLGMKVEKGLIAGLDYTKSEEHVWRIWHLHKELRRRRPDFKLDRCTPRGGNVAAQQLGQVLMPNGSLVESLNQDGLSFQGSGYSWVAMEEFSKFKNCDYMYGQALLVTEGIAGGTGGHVVIVTNASSSKAWQKLKSLAKPVIPTEAPTNACHPDRAERVEGPGLDTSQSLIPGVELGLTETGSRYLRIHYSADPAKDASWAQTESSKSPTREWKREMELSEAVFDGEPVFADYRDLWHSTVRWNKGHVPIVPGSAYIGGWDCGQTVTPAFVLLQVLKEPTLQVHAILEVVSKGGEPMEKFAPRVLAALRRTIPRSIDNVQHWGDTTVMTRNGANGETAQMAAHRHGIHIRPASNEWAGRYNAVTWLLTEANAKGGPMFVIDAANCPVLHEGFLGAYRYDVQGHEGSLSPEMLFPERPRKDGYSHVHDALQYAASRVIRMRRLGWI